ncbi:hypothetical protein [Usitatibacter palustris]|uniref:Uncharacterized protein n=1 Tax=Usitatibacter palustris TaxID=2732487 RepID=A0A6M4H3T4_9PROT|nr:hypothetical protein [Usitatibacter palustris]QJR14100.1 hypothetical protein DSM104440_00893 [Usitatibacter palustris]
MSPQPIPFGDDGQVATRELVARFALLAPKVKMLETLDRQFGGLSPLPVEDAEDLVAAVISEAGSDEGEAADLVVGVALWAIRHEVGLPPIERVANALAYKSNAAVTASELSAAFGLMQAVIAHVAPKLAADLERSDPERAWRILHLNFAITAIRSENEALMGFAFDALERALPDERAGFYAEAMALALAPGIAPQVREQIERRHLKWTVDR